MLLRGTFQRELDSTTEWLWDVAMGPVEGLLEDDRAAVLIPDGVIGLLPLHAARDRERPLHHRSLVDGLCSNGARHGARPQPRGGLDSDHRSGRGQSGPR